MSGEKRHGGGVGSAWPWRRLLFVAGLATIAMAKPHRPKTTTKRVTLRSNGSEVNSDNDFGAISGNGRFVTFESVGTLHEGRQPGERGRLPPRPQDRQDPPGQPQVERQAGPGRRRQRLLDLEQRPLRRLPRRGGLRPGGHQQHRRRLRQGHEDRQGEAGQRPLERIRASLQQPPPGDLRQRPLCRLRLRRSLRRRATRNGITDVFRHDMKTGKTIRVDIRSDGTQTEMTSTVISARQRGAEHLGRRQRDRLSSPPMTR